MPTRKQHDIEQLVIDFCATSKETFGSKKFANRLLHHLRKGHTNCQWNDETQEQVAKWGRRVSGREEGAYEIARSLNKQVDEIMYKVRLYEERGLRWDTYLANCMVFMSCLAERLDVSLSQSVTDLTKPAVTAVKE